MSEQLSGKTQDMGLGLVLIGVGIGGFLFVNPTDAEVVTGSGGMSWQTLPFIYSGLLILLSCLFLLETWFKEPEVEEVIDEQGMPDNHAWISNIRRFGIMTLLIAYAALIGLIGFAITTPIFLLALLYVFGSTNHVNNLLMAGIGGLLLIFLFVHLLRLPLSGAYWDPLTPMLVSTFKALGL